MSKREYTPEQIAEARRVEKWAAEQDWSRTPGLFGAAMRQSQRESSRSGRRLGSRVWEEGDEHDLGLGVHPLDRQRPGGDRQHRERGELQGADRVVRSGGPRAAQRHLRSGSEGDAMKEASVETLQGRKGDAYQTRVKCGHFRMHIFWRGDRDKHMHDHPSDFWTFPLVSYVEEVPHPDLHGYTEWRLVRAFRFHFRKAEHTHLVLGAWDGTWSVDPRNPRLRTPGLEHRPIVTLGWWFKKRREWGFHTDHDADQWTHWKDYVNQPGWDA